MINIRKAEKSDSQAILDLIKGLADYEKMTADVVATKENIEQTIFVNQFAEVYLAEYNSKIAGFSLFFYNYSTFLAKPGIYLEDLYVKPEYRSKGIGKSLLINLAKIAAERNCGRLEWSVLDWNTPAIEFYKSLKANPMDGWTTFRLTENNLEQLAKEEEK